MHNVLTLLSLSLGLAASTTGESVTNSFRGADLHLVERQTTTTTPSFIFQTSQNATTCQPFDIKWTFSGFTDSNASVNLVVTKLSNVTGATSLQTTTAAATGGAEGSTVLTGNAPISTPQNVRRRTARSSNDRLSARHHAHDTPDSKRDVLLAARQTTQEQQQVPVIVEQLTTATPLSQEDFLIQALNLPPNVTYTLSATIASNEGVLVFQSDPFFVAAGADQSCVINQATATVTTNAPTASSGQGATPVATVSVSDTATVTDPTSTSTTTKSNNKPVIIAAILGGTFFLFVIGIAVYTIRRGRMSRQNDEYESRQAFNDMNRF